MSAAATPYSSTARSVGLVLTEGPSRSRANATTPRLARVMEADQEDARALCAANERDADELRRTRELLTRTRNQITAIENRITARTQRLFFLSAREEWQRRELGRMEESRRAARVRIPPVDGLGGKAALTVRVHIGGTSASALYADELGDVRGVGVFVSTHHTLPVGTRIVVEIMLPGRSTPMRCDGQVAWTQEEAGTEVATSRGYAGMGVRLYPEDEDKWAYLDELCGNREPLFISGAR